MRVAELSLVRNGRESRVIRGSRFSVFHCRRNGFTLFELVLVLAVLVVLTALVYPSFEGLYDEMRVGQATDQVRACWAEARSRAMNEGRPYRFAILPGHGNFRVAPDTAQFWSGEAAPPAPVNATDWPLVLDDALPSPVRFLHGDSTPVDFHSAGASFQAVGSVDAGGWQTLATFLPDGTAREDVELIVYGPHARPMLLRLRGLTGTVTAEQLAREALAGGAR